MRHIVAAVRAALVLFIFSQPWTAGVRTVWEDDPLVRERLGLPLASLIEQKRRQQCFLGGRLRAGTSSNSLFLEKCRGSRIAKPLRVTGEPVDPLSRRVWMKRQDSPQQSLAVDPRRRPSPEIRDEVLNILNQATAGFVSEGYSVHIQTSASKQLARYLRDEETEDLPEAFSFSQQKLEVGAALVKAFTTSSGQAYLDDLCRAGVAIHIPGVSMARAVDSSGAVFCLQENEVDLTIKSPACIDSCGFPLACYGTPIKEIVDLLSTDTEQAAVRGLKWDRQSFLDTYCILSSGQKQLDSYCPKGTVARWTTTELVRNWKCYRTATDFSYAEYTLSCIDNCGVLQNCYGSPKEQQGEILQNSVIRVMTVMLNNCPCDERMPQGSSYVGCQKKTRLGETCQAWSSQIPHKHSFSIPLAKNYCRNPGGEPYIWCFTTNPALRFDICDPLGLAKQYLLPESLFDIEYRSSGATPFKAVRFFSVSSESAKCGDPSLKIANGVALPVDHNGVFLENPQSVIQDGDTQKLIWANIKLNKNQKGLLLACFCDFEFATALQNPSGSCSKPEAYNVEGGLLTIRGPVRFVQTKQQKFETMKPFTLEMAGVDLRPGDRLDLGINIQGGHCLMRSLSRSFSIARSFASETLSTQLAASWLKEAFNIETTTTFEKIEAKTTILQTGVTQPVSVYKIQEYVVCWTGEGTNGRAVGMVSTFRTTGFGVSDGHVATRSLSSTGANESLFSVFLRYAGPQLNYGTLMFTLREVTKKPCEGAEVARSMQVSAIDTGTGSLVVRASGLLLMQSASTSIMNNTPLHLCVNKQKELLFGGFATVQAFGVCQTWQISLDGAPKPVPLSTHQLFLEPFSPIGLHWLMNDAELLNKGGAKAFFTEGDFTKTLTFAVLADRVYLYAWTSDDLAPMQVGTIERQGWTAITTDVTFERCNIYAATKGPPAAIYKFDMSSPSALNHSEPLKTSSVPGFDDPCCLVTVYGNPEKQETPYILALGTLGGTFVWFDEDLQLVSIQRIWQGLSRPLEQPSSLSCVLESKSSSKTPLLPGEGEDKPGVIYSCFIADRIANIIVRIDVDTVAKTSVFVKNFLSLGTGGERLFVPVSVLAFKYEGETLIFTLEEGRQALDLLVSNSDGTTDYYSTMQSQSSGLGTPKLPFLVEVGQKGSGLDFAKIVLFRTTIDDISMQIISLDATAVAAAFTYSHAAWYIVGEEVVLEPVVAGSSSLNAFKSFTLNPNVPNFAYVSKVATISSDKGILTISLFPLTDPVVEIGVIGQGVVNEVTSSVTFQVACRNGHYMKDGMCVKCPAGTFNFLALVKQSPAERWGACKSCKRSTFTVSEGSTSEEQCICAKGYYPNEYAKELECVPCPAGTWKDTVANTGCIGVQCPANSSTTVTGAISAAARKCACNAGFVHENSLDACVVAPQGTFSPGGNMATAISCPNNTTTKPNNQELLTSLADCTCAAGFEPADTTKLADPQSAESLFKKWLQSIPEYENIEDSQVCVPCGRTRFKESVSAETCENCPTASYANTVSPKSKRECNLCNPGFYHTPNVEIPCGKCPEGFFCVGSEPVNPSLAPFSGLSVACPQNSSTLGDGLNEHPFKCTCFPGFEVLYIGDSETSCRAVEAGTFKDTMSNTGSTPCPLGGTSETAGADSLSRCICAPGEYRDENDQTCTVCPMGFYCLGGFVQGTSVESPKVPCPANMITSSTGSSRASDCVCGKGFYYLAVVGLEDNTQCTECLMNTYKDEIGNKLCRACNDNSGTKNTGATSASQCLCNAGFYFDDVLKECTACRELFKYCPGGSIPCTDEPSCVDGYMPALPVPCPENTRITAGFDTPSVPDDCLCNRGFAFREYNSEGLKICEPCQPGSYKSSVQDSNCNGLCGSQSTSLEGMSYQSQCFCEPNTYFASGGCQPCPVGATCLGGLTTEALNMLASNAAIADIVAADHIKPYAQPGFFLEKMHEELVEVADWFFLKCPVATSCLERGVCSKTMDNYLCSECKEGFTNTFVEEEICTRCPQMTWNILLVTGYYIALLLFNIGMAYMNVAAGFNRRSIHSIVIKIASNFFTCISVISVLNFDQLELPGWFNHLKSNVEEQISPSEKTHWMAVDCFLREGFNLSYADSFFYTMVFYFVLPVVLPVIVTLIMMVVVGRAKRYYRSSIQRKLGVLQQTIRFNLTSLTEQLRDKLEEDRLLMMFRYIPLPGENRWRRAYKFFEDMIPIYVTVLFFIYTSTTRQMLSLLDCVAIDFGKLYGSSYFLNAAMSIECNVHPSSAYFKFALLGALGLMFWSIGIPLLAFIALYTKRKNLNSRETRLKYGFLHNGFVKKYWYWETVVFARKLSVLVISSVGFYTSSDGSIARLVATTAIAIAFNILHLRCQPFDKRSYLTLDRLENHSMAIWTLSSCMLSLLLGANFSGSANVVLIALILFPVLSFILEVAVSLVFAYFDNVRSTRMFFRVPVLGLLFRFFASLSEKRRAKEPMVLLDQDDMSIQLVSARRTGVFMSAFRVRNKSINFEERSYFLKVMAEALGFAVVHLKLDIIPGSFLEFALRLGLAFSKLEQDSQNNKESLQALARGDMSKLVDWTKQEEAKQMQRKKLIHQKSSVNGTVQRFYSHWQKKLDDTGDAPSLGSSDEEEQRERTRDLEGGNSEPEDSDEAYDLEGRMLDLEKLVSRMTEEEQAETMYLFDEEVVSCGIALSELYLALLKLQLKSPTAIGDQFEAFREKRDIVAAERATSVRLRNKKLKVIKSALLCSLNTPDGSLEGVLPSAEENIAIQQRLDATLKRHEFLRKQLEHLKTEPDAFQDDKESYLEWIDAAGTDEEASVSQDAEEEPASAPEQETAAPTLKGTVFGSSGSDLSDAGESIEKPPSRLLDKPFKVVGANAEDWVED